MEIPRRNIKNVVYLHQYKAEAIKYNFHTNKLCVEYLSEIKISLIYIFNLNTRIALWHQSHTWTWSQMSASKRNKIQKPCKHTSGDDQYFVDIKNWNIEDKKVKQRGGVSLWVWIHTKTHTTPPHHTTPHHHTVFDYILLKSSVHFNAVK